MLRMLARSMGGTKLLEVTDLISRNNLFVNCYHIPLDVNRQEDNAL